MDALCELLVYATCLRYLRMLRVCATCVRYLCTLLVYTTCVRYLCKLLVYATCVRYLWMLLLMHELRLILGLGEQQNINSTASFRGLSVV